MLFPEETPVIAHVQQAVRLSPKDQELFHGIHEIACLLGWDTVILSHYSFPRPYDSLSNLKRAFKITNINFTVDRLLC